MSEGSFVAGDEVPGSLWTMKDAFQKKLGTAKQAQKTLNPAYITMYK